MFIVFPNSVLENPCLLSKRHRRTVLMESGLFAGCLQGAELLLAAAIMQQKLTFSVGSVRIGRKWLYWREPGESCPWQLRGFGTLVRDAPSPALLSWQRAETRTTLGTAPASGAWTAMATCFSPFLNEQPSPQPFLPSPSQQTCNKWCGATDEAGKTCCPFFCSRACVALLGHVATLSLPFLNLFHV